MAQKASTVGLSLAGKGFFGSLCAGTFGLGVWQTRRYFEKTDLVAERQEALARPPLTEYTADRDNGFHRMRLTGHYVYDQECLVGPRSPPVGALPDKPGSSGQGMARAPMGYYVLTPFVPDATINNNSTSSNENNSTNILVVNRGWIPRHLVHDESKNRRLRTPQQQQEAPRTLPSWDRPTGSVTVSCITMATEQPRIVVPEHKMHMDPPELFWMDLDTLREYYYHRKFLTIAQDNKNNHTKNSTTQSTTPSSSSSPVHVEALVTRVQEEDDDESDKTSHRPADKASVLSFPVAPPAQHVGEFKTSPAIHAGYAATWYGLSMAGLYMTRMLILRK